MAKQKTKPIERKHYTKLFRLVANKAYTSSAIAKTIGKNANWYHSQVNYSAQLKNLVDVGVLMKNGFKKDAQYFINYSGIMQLIYDFAKIEKISVVDNKIFYESLEYYIHVIKKNKEIENYSIKAMIEAFLTGACFVLMLNLGRVKYLDKFFKKRLVNHIMHNGLRPFGYLENISKDVWSQLYESEFIKQISDEQTHLT